MSWMVSSLTDVASALASQQSNREAVAQAALARGAKMVQDKKYDAAISAFKCAAALQPGLTEAYTYMGRVQLFLGRTEDAIAAYRKAVGTDPTSADTHRDLANACIQAKQYGEAERELKAALAIEPGSSDAHEALGHVYLTTDRVYEAELEFGKATRIAPTQASGFYSLGLACNKAGDSTRAIDEFRRAISLDRTYANAYVDLARSYVALGEKALAQEQVTALDNLNTAQGNTLARELDLELFTPQIFYADSRDSSFDPYLGPNTQVSLLDPSLATPGAAKIFTLKIQFNQAMDPGSVMRSSNWSILRATGGTAGVYDNGVVLHQDQEAGISPIPLAVIYDETNYTATVYFMIRQNDAGNATIDPSHWVFRFGGTDANGNKIDPAGDEFDGAAMKPF
ncbi:MAG TPA: tetratricopeptide repeat protein [Terriglobales bacterium]|nr:tetratricopeptide repeat protein [Terriglobales bacterium]